jgi:hypothetical protein
VRFCSDNRDQLCHLLIVVLARNAIIPLFFRLGDWAAGSLGLLASIRERRAFRDIGRADLELLAECGRLLLLLDGWNEIDAAAQRKLRIEIDKIRREFPDVRIIVTTRRQMLDVPISGPRIEIEQLSEDQQIDIARQACGDAGEEVVDSAWRESGLRDLIARPLYLNSLLPVDPHRLQRKSSFGYSSNGMNLLPTTPKHFMRW